MRNYYTILAAMHYYMHLRNRKGPAPRTPELTDWPCAYTGSSLHDHVAPLVRAGLLRRVEEKDIGSNNGLCYTATEGLRMYVERIMSLDFPVQAWVQPRG